MLPRLFALATGLGLRAAGGRATEVPVEGATLRTWALGPEAGEPWLLLHGLGATALSWLPVLPALRDCRLLLPELSALGGSRGAAAGLGVASGARAAATLIEDHFSGRPVTVCGASLGGWMAVRLALERPELVARLVLFDCAGYRDQDWERIERLARVERFGDVAPLHRALFARRRAVLALLRPVFYRVYTSAAVHEALAGLAEADVFDDRDLARLEAPVGLVWGERDGLFELGPALAMARAIPGARLEVIPGAAHGPQWEAPRRAAAALARMREELPVVAFGRARIPAAP